MTMSFRSIPATISRKLRLRGMYEQYARPVWPVRTSAKSHDRVSVVIVNYNTAALTGALIFSLYRVLGRDQISRIVVVDNASTDPSVDMLKALQREGLVDVIFNKKQFYHGLGLNQAMNHLARLRRADTAGKRESDHVWILDSDTVILRRDAHRVARKFMEEGCLPVVGEFTDNAVTAGYAHPCTLLVDAARVWQRNVRPFDNSWRPALELEMSLRRQGCEIGNFPYLTGQYVLHLGRGTLKTIADTGEASNAFYEWALDHNEAKYGPNPGGKRLYDEFLIKMHDAVGEPGIENLVKACRETELITLNSVSPG